MKERKQVAEMCRGLRRPRLWVQVSEIHRGPRAFRNLLGALHIPRAGGQAGEVGALGGVALAGGAGRARGAGVSGGSGLPLRAGAPRKPVFGVAGLPRLTWPRSKTHRRGSGFSGADGPVPSAPPRSHLERASERGGSGHWALCPAGLGRAPWAPGRRGSAAWTGQGQPSVPSERRDGQMRARDGKCAPYGVGGKPGLLCSHRLLGGLLTASGTPSLVISHQPDSVPRDTW